MTASGTVLSLACKLLTHARLYNGDGTGDGFANPAFSAALVTQGSRVPVSYVSGTQRILGQKVSTKS